MVVWSVQQRKGRKRKIRIDKQLLACYSSLSGIGIQYQVLRYPRVNTVCCQLQVISSAIDKIYMIFYCRLNLLSLYKYSTFLNVDLLEWIISIPFKTPFDPQGKISIMGSHRSDKPNRKFVSKQYLKRPCFWIFRKYKFYISWTLAVGAWQCHYLIIRNWPERFRGLWF